MDPRHKYDDICRELNMDKETERKSWNIYEHVKHNFLLEGEQSHWICCALYVTCRESFTPTVGGSDSVVKGNCISLTKLLRSCNISIYEFFLKIKKWAEFSNLTKSFLNQMERLERSFSISYLLYEKYKTTFEKVFNFHSSEKRNKKSKPGKCSAKKLYDFCWCLFLCSKGEEPTYTVDLVTSFHLLLCCIEIIFNNIIIEKKIDLINSSFCDFTKFIKDSSDVNIKKINILKSLCQLHETKYDEVSEMKQTSLKKILQKFINTNVLKNGRENYYDLIAVNNFDFNLKSLNNTYEQYVLSVGEFDERIFLNNTMLNENISELNSESKQITSTLRSLVPGTPLTRKHHLPNKEVLEPISSATQNVRKLQSIADCPVSQEFSMLIEESMQRIEEILENMCTKFCAKYPTRSEAKKRFMLAKSLYFYLLDKIVRVELKTKPKLDLKILLKSDIMHIQLIACSLELVIVAYNSNQIKFPWILECFDIQPFHFYRIIEMVVMRHDDILTRALIKHLNTIEEKCLDSLVWTDTSALWESLKQLDSFPPWTSVESTNMTNPTTLRKNDDGALEKRILFSPVNSAYECFDPAVPGESARRNLFNEGKATDNKTEKPNVKVDEKRKGSGSLCLFCRKFYKLAYLRIDELCKELDLRTDDILKQIWTLFEYSVVHKTELMKDRHLDQIIMCAIYVFIKVKDIQGKNFTDIMKFYRNQPQAASNIYREVLIEPAKKNEIGEIIAQPVYNDIINFYNNVYVIKMTPYALQFGDKSKSPSALMLSPHPPEKILSPRKISYSHNLYVQQLEKTVGIPQSPHDITYEFHKSPAKSLEKMNQIINSAGKRNLPFSTEDDGIGNDMPLKIKRNGSARFVTKKMQNVIMQRRDDGRI